MGGGFCNRMLITHSPKIIIIETSMQQVHWSAGALKNGALSSRCIVQQIHCAAVSLWRRCTMRQVHCAVDALYSKCCTVQQVHCAALNAFTFLALLWNARCSIWDAPSKVFLYILLLSHGCGYLYETLWASYSHLTGLPKSSNTHPASYSCMGLTKAGYKWVSGTMMCMDDKTAAVAV